MFQKYRLYHFAGLIASILTIIGVACRMPLPPPQTQTQAASSPEPASPIFEYAWSDRSLYRSGLVNEEQDILDGLPGASVYHIDINIAETFDRLTGRQALYYTNNEDMPLPEIYLRLYPNLADGRSTVSSMRVNEQAVESVYEWQDSALRIPLPNPLQPGQVVVIDFEFEVMVPSDGGGNYQTFVWADNVLALAHFYPIAAVFEEGTWDLEIPSPNGDVIYAESSFYIVRVAAPAELVLVASGVEIERFETEGQQTLTFAGGPMRDFYMAASPDYDLVSEKLGEVTVNSYFLPGHTEGAKAGLQHAVDALWSFSQRFGPYPYTEFDIVPTPTEALGVEYPGITAINLRLYPRYTILFEVTIAHEVAHEWFYSTVGNDQLAEPWLDEALAQYVTYLYFIDLNRQADAQGYRGSWQGRLGGSDQDILPIGLPVADYPDAMAYSGFVYGRGPLFYDQLSQMLGQEMLDQVIRDYYLRHQWGVATSESLQASAEETCACDLDALFAEWVYE